MKISSVISLLLLSTLLHEVQGIRLGKGSISKRIDQEFQEEEDIDLIKRSEGGVHEEEVACKDGQCSGTKNTRFTRVIKKESHHWLPKIHEDYYGPKVHSPRHH